MSLIGSSILAGASGAGGAYTINQSLRLNDDDSNYLEWTPSSAGNRQKWTWSAWVKRSALNSNDTLFSAKSNTAQIYLTTGDLIRVEQYDGGGGYDFRRDFDGKMRDTSAWYHLVVIYDSAQGTEADRIKCYRNGERLGVDYTYNTMSQSFESEFNNTEPHWLGKIGAGQYWDGYLAEVHFIDGQALDSSYFGETGTYGEWKPSEYTGTYGTNGWYLPFKQDYAVEGMSTTLYTGIGSNSVGTHYIGGVGFRPDLVWIKDRETTYQHVLFDSVRGPGRRAIQSNSSAAEGMPNNSYDRLVAFDADGFTHHGGQYGSAYVDRGGADYVAWCWDMGGRNTVTGFGATTWTGDGQQQLITGIGFQPDLVWLKRRNTIDSHGIFDSVRGPTKWLATDQTWADTTTSNSLLKFDKDGFTIGSYSNFNYTDSTFVAYGWDMGGETVSNTDGSITSSVRANQTYGQSVVSYTGTGTSNLSETIGHGLSQAPEMVIVKNRTSADGWIVYHSGTGANPETQRLILNDTHTVASYGEYYWNDTAPTSSVFTVGSSTSADNALNQSDDYIAYCFHSVSGYSKFGSYSGTDSAGVTVTTGFRPAFVIIKCTNLTENWVLIDSMRSPYNDANDYFFPNLNNAESSSSAFDIEFTDTGFVLNGTNDAINGYNGGTGEYIYMAFAGGYDSITDYNSDGSTHSRVRANPTYGQSIVSDIATGNDHTIGHGLSQAPEMIFRKKRYSGTSRNWAVWHKDLTDGYALEGLNTNGAEVSGGSPSKYIRSVNSTTFTVGNDVSVNENTGNYVSYCFHSVSGYSKIGSYTGNGSTSNTITTGFKPAFVMIKNTDQTTSWVIADNMRDSNGTPDSPDKYLHPNTTDAEGQAQWIDFLDTGFKIKLSNTTWNGNGDTLIYMAFADKREFAYWLDQSGNNNDWLPTNLTESDVSLDTPSNNFATWNPLMYRYGTTNTYAEGNSKVTFTSAGTEGYAFGTIGGLVSGKWYWEVYVNATGSDTRCGISNSVLNSSGVPTSYREYTSSGYKAADTGASLIYNTYTAGDIIGVAVDLDNGTLKFYKNNSLEGTAFTDLVSAMPDGGWIPEGMGYNNSTTTVNFGQDSSFAGKVAAQGNQDGNSIGDFYYTPPSGYLALCTSNMSDPAVTPSENFNAVTYTGAGTPTAVTGVGFQPDWGWFANRAGDYHPIYDVQRGTNRLYSTGYALETSGSFTSWDSDGFTVSADGEIGDNGVNYVAWLLKADNTTGSSDTNGSITSTVSANPDAGFSIVGYTGVGSSSQTVGHGLSSTPEMIWLKSRSGNYTWIVYHKDMIANPEQYYMELQGTGTPNDYAFWNDTAPTSSVFSIGNFIHNNNNGDNYIAYCWHSVPGFSKIGSYTGNGSSDGTFVYTGFRPAFVMVKRTDTSNVWGVMDTDRVNANYQEFKLIEGNSNAAEDGGANYVDMLSNGFKARASSLFVNASGGSYIYIAFAETPFKYSNAR